MRRRRVDVQAILANPEQRNELLAGAVRFIQAVEGRDLTLDEARDVVKTVSRQHAPTTKGSA